MIKSPQGFPIQSPYLSVANRQAEIIDYVESYIFNSDKCFAVWRP